jgi:hypothetical protein
MTKLNNKNYQMTKRAHKKNEIQKIQKQNEESKIQEDDFKLKNQMISSSALNNQNNNIIQNISYRTATAATKNRKRIMYQQTNDPKSSYKNVGQLEPIPSILE